MVSTFTQQESKDFSVQTHHQAITDYTFPLLALAIITTRFTKRQRRKLKRKLLWKMFKQSFNNLFRSKKKRDGTSQFTIGLGLLALGILLGVLSGGGTILLILAGIFTVTGLLAAVGVFSS